MHPKRISNRSEFVIVAVDNQCLRTDGGENVRSKGWIAVKLAEMNKLFSQKCGLFLAIP